MRATPCPWRNRRSWAGPCGGSFPGDGGCKIKKVTGGTVKGQAALVGAYEHPTRRAPGRTQCRIMAESARGALEDAGLALGDVDGLFASGGGALGAVSLAEHLNLNP